MWIERIDTKNIINAVKTSSFTGIKTELKLIFILEKEGALTITEAKYSERPRPEKLNFRKVAPLFQTKVNCLVACKIREKGIIHLKNYSMFNPLFGYA